MTLDSVKAKGLLSQIDITFMCDGNRDDFGFLDPVMRSIPQSYDYYTVYYEPSLAACVKTAFYRTTLTKEQFYSAKTDETLIDKYFSDSSILRSSVDTGPYPKGSCVLLETIYPTSTIEGGNVLGFKNVVSGKRGLIYVRDDQALGWPLSTYTTKVDIVREK